jgi:hypothetical protein
MSELEAEDILVNVGSNDCIERAPAECLTERPADDFRMDRLQHLFESFKLLDLCGLCKVLTKIGVSEATITCSATIMRWVATIPGKKFFY